MQTLLPLTDFDETAKILRTTDLENQILQCIIVLDTLHEVEGRSTGWRNHPVMEMWRGHEAHLCHYSLTMCDEFKYRYRYEPEQAERIRWHLDNVTCVEDFEMTKPEWMEDPLQMNLLQRSHRSFLMSKDSRFYRKYKWDVPTGLPLYWPKADSEV